MKEPHHLAAMGGSIAADEVHIWCVRLDDASSRMPFDRLLADDELDRARRYRRMQDARRFATRRAILRLLLAQYAGSMPSSVAFELGPHGKPSATSSSTTKYPTFSVSRSGAIALYAFAKDVEIGIDLEDGRRETSSIDVARQFFSRLEFAELMAYPEPERSAAFLRCWTRKEAYVKALGAGLSHPLDTFDVSLSRGGTHLLRRIHGSRRAAARWTLAAMEPVPGYVAALAAPIRTLRIATRSMRAGDAPSLPGLVEPHGDKWQLGIELVR